MFFISLFSISVLGNKYHSPFFHNSIIYYILFINYGFERRVLPQAERHVENSRFVRQCHQARVVAVAVNE